MMINEYTREFTNIFIFGVRFVAPKVLLLMTIHFIVKKRTVRTMSVIVPMLLLLINCGYVFYEVFRPRNDEMLGLLEFWYEVVSWFWIPPFLIPIYGMIQILKAKKAGRNIKRKLIVFIGIEILSIGLMIVVGT